MRSTTTTTNLPSTAPKTPVTGNNAQHPLLRRTCPLCQKKTSLPSLLLPLMSYPFLRRPTTGASSNHRASPTPPHGSPSEPATSIASNASSRTFAVRIGRQQRPSFHPVRRMYCMYALQKIISCCCCCSHINPSLQCSPGSQDRLQ